MRRILISTLILIIVGLAVAACSIGGSKQIDAEAPYDPDEARQMFQASCRICHSLADANAAGVFGPSLDQLQPDAQRVYEQIDEGGGGMPADIVDDEDAQQIARYVAEVAGTIDDDELPTSRDSVRAPRNEP